MEVRVHRAGKTQGDTTFSKPLYSHIALLPKSDSEHPVLFQFSITSSPRSVTDLASSGRVHHGEVAGL